MAIKTEENLLMDIREAAPYLHVAPSRVYAMIAHGIVPERVTHRLGTRLYLRRAKFLAWLTGEENGASNS